MSELRPILVPLTVSENNMTVPLGVNEAINVQVGADYEYLTHKPQINGVTLIGDKSWDDLGLEPYVQAVTNTYTHTQSQAAATWTIAHNLNKHPSVTVVDSAGSVCYGNVQYTDANTVVVTFQAAFAGTAYLN